MYASKHLSRARILLYLLIMAFLIIGYRLYQLQVNHFKTYTTMSMKNQFKIVGTVAKRGSIYDRSGTPLAYDKTEYQLNIDWDASMNKDQIGALLAKSKIFTNTNENKNLEKIVPINSKQLLKIAPSLHLYPEITLKKHVVRQYPTGKVNSHLIGFFGKADLKDLASYPSYERQARVISGKSGIEKEVNDALTGKPGITRQLINAKNRILSSQTVFESKSGRDIFLTIDNRLQNAAMKALKGSKGAIVAIQPQTGEILSIVSSPSFDPDVFCGHKSSEKIKTIISDARQPMFNRSINGLYSPASTIKPFIALHALQEEVVMATSTIFDPGYFHIPGSKHRFNNWFASGHGTVDVIKAIQLSCDTYFYDLAYKMGISELKKLFSNFGLGEPTGSFRNESHGNVPTPEQQTHKWHVGNTVITGIGQGQLLATPLQLASITAALSLNVTRVNPHIILGYGQNGKLNEPSASQFNPKPKYSDRHWQTILKGMQSAMGPRGTGRIFENFPIPIAGKTGTAQLVKIDRKRELPDHLRDNSLFIAFTPVDKPEIALAVVIENKHTATQVAHDFLRFWYDNVYTKT